MPTMMMGSAAVFIDCDECWKLLLVTRKGSLYVLATRHAFLGSAQNGELAALQVDVRKFLARKPGWSRVTDDGMQTRAHLESQLASALALQSANEYRQCLLSYVRFLAREADESRLREVCEGFLGPPTGMAEAGSSEPKNLAWDPCVLGMKKHKLLKEDILPAMASNWKVQRLLNEFMDLLSEYNSFPRPAMALPSPSNTVQPSVETETDQTHPIDQAMNEMEVVPDSPETNQINDISSGVKDQPSPTQVDPEEGNPTPDQMDVDIPRLELVVALPAKGSGS